MIILGVDPGVSGGLALVEQQDDRAPPRLLAVADVPTTGEKTRRRVNANGVMSFIMLHRPDYALIEHAHSMPKQGVSSTFVYGRAVGALEACIEALNIPVTIVEPS